MAKYYEVDISLIKPLERAGGNGRKDYGENDGSLQELANSILENGIIQPMTGFRDDKNIGYWFITDGHRRLKAANNLIKQKKIKELKVQMKACDSKITDEEIILNMVISNEGKPLNILELADLANRLKEKGWLQKDIAKKFGKSIMFVSNLEKFHNEAPDELKQMILDGKIVYTNALNMLKQSKDGNEALEKVKEVVSKLIVKKPKAKDYSKNSLRALKNVLKEISAGDLDGASVTDMLYLFLNKIAMNEANEDKMREWYLKINRILEA